MNSEIDRYIQAAPPSAREKLHEIRSIIQSAVPEAVEKISYSMPAYDLNGILVYFAGYEKHVGFYPTANGIEAFKAEIAEFKHSKGAIQFPLDKPLPAELIRRIVIFRAGENATKRAKPKR